LTTFRLLFIGVEMCFSTSLSSAILTESTFGCPSKLVRGCP